MHRVDGDGRAEQLGAGVAEHGAQRHDGAGAADAAGRATDLAARAADADPVLQETTLRLRPELAAAGYGSQLATCAVDPVAGPAACPRDTTLATISLAGRGLENR